MTAWPVVALTGHRPQHLSAPARDWVRTNLLSCATWLREQRNTTIAVSGFALGADLWWAAAAVRAGLELWAYLPYPQQAQHWPVADRAEWARLRGLANPARERVFGDRYSVQALHARNDGMLDDGDALVSVWDPGKTDGGTYSATRKASQRGMAGIHLDPARQKVRFELPDWRNP